MWRGKEILVPYLLDSVPRSAAGKKSRAAGAGWLAALQCKPSRNPPFTPSSWQVPWQVEAFLKILPVTLPSNPGIEMPSAWGVGEQRLSCHLHWSSEASHSCVGSTM